MDRKLRLGPWFDPAFKALRAGRRLRGTKLDPFGRAQVRKVERSLPEEYCSEIRRALALLNSGNHAAVVALAQLPDMVRGYEDIKLANVTEYRNAMAAAMSALRQPLSPSVTMIQRMASES
jgi:indolepyruvate ferredoxin oxidoreductase